MQYLVYLITRDDGMKYVGTTNDSRIKTRMNQHKNSDRFRGFDFTYEILSRHDDIKECYMKEELFIKKLDTYINGLNASENGRGKNNSKRFTTLGCKFSEDAKKKMSKTRKRKILLGEITIHNKGKSWSTEMKQHFSEIRKGKRHSSKLCWDDVNEIREAFERRDDIEDVSTIAKNGKVITYECAFAKKYSHKYGVSAACIRKIINGKTWSEDVIDK